MKLNIYTVLIGLLFSFYASSQVSTHSRLFSIKNKAEDFYKNTSFDSSLFYANIGINLSEKLKSDSMKVEFYRLKGNNFYRLQNKIQAHEYYQKAFNIAKNNKYTYLLALLYTNLAILKIDEAQIEKAEFLLENSIKLHKKVSNKFNQKFLQARYLLLACYKYTKKIKNVIPDCEELLKDFRKSDDKHSFIGHLFFYSSCLFEKNINRKAIQLLDEAIVETMKINNLDLQRQAYREKSLILQSIGDDKNATINLQKSYALYEKMLRKEVTKATSEAEIKYKTELISKQKRIVELKNIRNKQALHLSENKRNNMIWLIVAIILVSLFGFLIFFIYQQNQKQKFEKQKAIDMLNMIVESQEKERSRIAKDLHDGIVQDMTVLKLKLNQEKNSDSSHFLSEFDKTIKQVREISYQMMPVTLIELGLVPAMEDILEKILKPNNISFDFEAIHIDFRFPENIEVSLFRITQELVNNVIKHSKAKHVSVILRFQNDQITLIFEDDGQGFNPDSSKKGIGLNSLFSRVELVNGNINYESNLDSGTIAIIRIPFKK